MRRSLPRTAYTTHGMCISRMYGVVCLLTRDRPLRVSQEFNGKQKYCLPEEWVARCVGKYTVNGKVRNICPSWWGYITLHTACEEYQNESFPNCWLGRGWDVALAQRSPYLKTLNYYLLGHMKSRVYETNVESRAALHDRILAAAEHKHNHSGNVVSSSWSLLMRAENCVANG